jgi:hypothetical protein
LLGILYFRVVQVFKGTSKNVNLALMDIVDRNDSAPAEALNPKLRERVAQALGSAPAG